MAVVATSTPKRHGFSIESLIGRRDDSPRRQPIPTLGLLPGPHDFSATRDPKDRLKDLAKDKDFAPAAKDLRKDSAFSREAAVAATREAELSRLVESRRELLLMESLREREGFRGVARDVLREGKRDAFRDHVNRDLLARDAAFRDHVNRDSFRDHVNRDSFRDHVNRDGFREVSREGFREVCRDGFRDHPTRDGFREVHRDNVRDHVSRPRSRQGTPSPPSSFTTTTTTTTTTTGVDEDRTSSGAGTNRTSSPSSPTVLSPRVDGKALTPTSPEAENRLGGWSGDDLKHLLGGVGVGMGVGVGGFPPQAHPAMEASGLFQPLRVCNRSLSAAMSSAAALMPQQFAGLSVNPLLYNLHRELAAPHPSTHPLLAARYPGFVHPRYPLGPPPGLLFHPYRKPKRNRTAFSPSQLLQLEQAFEKNHYVVGQERKTLASKLQLTETQVKVWFQNRRTKHKRMKAEEEATGCGVTSGDEAGKTGDNREGNLDMKSDSSDHELVEDDLCSSDEEELSVTEDS